MAEPIPEVFLRAFPPPTFAEVTGDDGVTHAAMVAALEAEFSLAGHDPLARRPSPNDLLERLAGRFEAIGEAHPYDQLRLVGEILERDLRVIDPDSVVLDDLLLDRVRVRGRGHELSAILLAITAADQVGLELDLVASREMALLAHPLLEGPWLLAPARRWELVDARTLGDPDLAWICPHEAAAMWLHLLMEHAMEGGDRMLAIRALDRELELPMAGPERTRLERLHTTLRLRLD